MTDINTQTQWPIGMRVCGGIGEDYDEGTVTEREACDWQDFGADMVAVAWDSGVTTATPVVGLRALEVT